jgi:hypothetical protein
MFEQTKTVNNTTYTDTAKMKITIGDNIFTATFNNSATATAFKTRLPITVTMTELNGNEKYVDLPTALPANASYPKLVHSGEVMLYGSKTLVLFYKTFSTEYSYTPVGRIENPAGLAAALGSGNVTVRFETD